MHPAAYGKDVPHFLRKTLSTSLSYLIRDTVMRRRHSGNRPASPLRISLEHPRNRWPEPAPGSCRPARLCRAACRRHYTIVKGGFLQSRGTRNHFLCVESWLHQASLFRWGELKIVLGLTLAGVGHFRQVRGCAVSYSHGQTYGRTLISEMDYTDLGSALDLYITDLSTQSPKVCLRSEI